MIKIVKFKDVQPQSVFCDPQSRAIMFVYAGLDYLVACNFTQENHLHIGPLWYFRLPTMHQTLELFSKAVALMADNSFDARKYKHHVKKLMEAYKGQVPVFASILAITDAIELLDALEQSYLGVRYGECALTYDGDAWILFQRIASELLNDLRKKTGLRFPDGYIERMD